ncbi:MAG: L-threonylcarbamoyladenylate synthase [Parachlamydiaceae bacterium]
MRISLEQAIDSLRSGQVVAVPTETVYGLAASIEKNHAIEHIFELKKRPHSNPLIIHLADWREINQYVTHYPPSFEALAKAFWPGSLTCILPVQSHVPMQIRAGLATGGFRIPDLALTRELIRETGPLVMPSANLSGRPSSTRVEHVEEDFGIDFPVLDGGICSRGVESTILLYQDPHWVIVRLGALSPETFQTILGYRPLFVKKTEGASPLCPGQHFRHYAPRAKLILGEKPALHHIPFILGFKERSYPSDKKIILLGSLQDPNEVAENLYQALRQLDQEGADAAWVDLDFPREGLWETIAERLMRAAEPLPIQLP